MYIYIGAYTEQLAHNPTLYGTLLLYHSVQHPGCSSRSLSLLFLSFFNELMLAYKKFLGFLLIELGVDSTATTVDGKLLKQIQ